MVKYLLSFLFIFLMLTSISFAKISDAKLQQEYGKNLTQAPYFLRYAYYQKYHRDWGKTYYSDRKAFLYNYEVNLAAEKLQARMEAKAEAAKEKERLFEKRAQERKIRDRLKAEQAEERAEEQADADRQKDFNAAVKASQQELHQMEQSLSGR